MIFGLAFTFININYPSEKIVWFTYYPEALLKAQDVGKCIMLYFYSTKWGVWRCDQLETEVFGNKEVISFINSNFISVKIDIDDPEQMRMIPGNYKFARQNFLVPIVVWLSPDGIPLEGFYGVEPDRFLDKAKAALSRAEVISSGPTVPSTQMLLMIEKEGWVEPYLYLSPIYHIGPGETIQHTCIYEKASSNDWITVRLLIRTCEQEGIIEYYVNQEFLGISYITEEVARGEEIASCCGPAPWMGGIGPPKKIVQMVKSTDYEGEFQFVLIVLIEKPD